MAKGVLPQQAPSKLKFDPTPKAGKNFLTPRANKDKKVSTLVNMLGGKKSKGVSTPSITPKAGPTLAAGPSVASPAPDLFSQPGMNGAPIR